MHFRRLLAIGSLILIGGILAACGSDDEDATPTATTAPATRVTSDQTAIIEPTATAAETATEESDTTIGTPGATPAATPVDAEATPEKGLYTGSEEDLMSTPQVQPIVVPPTTSEPLVELDGTLTLDGRLQQDYTITDEGCVGLGEWRQLAPGTQVIVRDASGTVVDIAILEAQDGVDCAWGFSIEAPAADFFSVSIPMVTEVWFDQTDPAVQNGAIELFVP